MSKIACCISSPGTGIRGQPDLTGPGEIAAVGNGNAATTEPFQADYRQALNDLAMVIVRSKSGKSGEISLIARSEGLQESCAVVTSR